jgi:hypothetical protein
MRLAISVWHRYCFGSCERRPNRDLRFVVAEGDTTMFLLNSHLVPQEVEIDWGWATLIEEAKPDLEGFRISPEHTSVPCGLRKQDEVMSLRALIGGRQWKLSG